MAKSLLHFPGLTYQNKASKGPKKTKKRKKKRSSRGGGAGEWSSEGEEEVAVVAVEVNRGRGEMPEGAQESDGADSDAMDLNDPHRALDINLDE